MAQRPSPQPSSLLGWSTVEGLRRGIAAVSTCRTLQTALLAAVDAIAASAGESVVARALVQGVVGNEEVGPVGGSTQRRLLLERFLVTAGDGPGGNPVLAGVHHVERAIVVVDGVEVAVVEAFAFEPVDPVDFAAVIGALADAVALVARAARDERRVLDQLRMIGNLSHELRTPLTTLVGYTDLLTSWRDLDDATRDNALAVLDRQARRMMRLSLEAGTVAKSGDASAVVLHFDRVDLAAALEVAATDLSLQREITVRCHEGLWVRADPDRLQQMLLNLIGNALAHGKPPIEVRAERGPTGSFVNVSVMDRGPGIDLALLPHVFEPFTRGRADGSDDHAGLGLAIVRQLAQGHGGDLFYEPNRPTGAKMTLSLPAIEP
jgi:signal transduction histidine kinase